MPEFSNPPDGVRGKDFILVGERSDDDVVVITRSSYEKMVITAFTGIMTVLICLLAWLGNGVFKRLDVMEVRLNGIERQLENTITLEYLQENFVSLLAFTMLQEKVEKMENERGDF